MDISARVQRHSAWRMGAAFLTDPEIRGDLLHSRHQVGAQILHVFQIVLHGEGQVHKVVQVDGVVLGTFEFQPEGLRFAWMGEKGGYLNTGVCNSSDLRSHVSPSNLPDLSVRVSFWGWIWVICSGFSSPGSFLRLVTGLSLFTTTLPRGFSISTVWQFLFFRDSRSSQRADLDSPSPRKD